AASIRYEIVKPYGISEADGASPRGRLFRASDGRLYGTTQRGGILRAGTVFGMNRDGSGFVVLHSFEAARKDGIYPAGGVIEASDGVLYGTTSGGGRMGAGTVFRVTKDGSDYRILHHMGVVDGLGPIARLLEGSDGLLYGTTPDGGAIDG